MPWEDFRTFLAVAREGSHAAAGRALRVDPTTVGRRVAALERALGARLFARTADGLRKTDAGERLLPRAERMEAEALAAERELAGDDASPEGSVRITGSDGLLDYVVVPGVSELLRSSARLVLSVRAETRILDLSRREADVALRLVAPKEPTLVARRVGSMTFGVFAAQALLDRVGRPRRLDDLRTQAFVGFDAEHAGLSSMRWLEKRVAPQRFTLRATTTSAQVRACRAGLGFALLPRFVAPHEPGLVQVLEHVAGPAREIWIVTHRDVRRSPRVSRVIDVLGACLARTPGIEPARRR
jgi:DNA-binding transcriptional LysR family regulator